MRPCDTNTANFFFLHKIDFINDDEVGRVSRSLTTTLAQKQLKRPPSFYQPVQKRPKD